MCTKSSLKDGKRRWLSWRTFYYRAVVTMRDEKQGYQLSALTQQQTQNLVNQLRPCPVPAYLTCNPFGCNGGFTGYGYGYNDGCGCGC